jgi:hypothetical protein
MTQGMRLLRTIFWWALALVTVAYVVPRLGEWGVASRIETLRPGWLVLAGAILSLHYALVFALWVLHLRTLGSSQPLGAAIRAYSLSLLPKYVPGKVVSQGVRVRLATEAGAPLLTISASLVLEMGLGVGSAGVVALFALVQGVPAYLARSARWLAIALGVGSAVFIGLLVAPLPIARWKQRMGLSLSPSRVIRLGLILALYSAGWIISALSHLALAQAIQPLPFRDVVPLGLALTISWGIGTLSLFAPAGLGVKDGILYLAVRGLMGNQNALIFAALSRVLSIAVELAITAGYWAFTWARRAPTRAPREPEPRRPATPPAS